MKNRIRNNIFILLAIVAVGFSSCDNYLDVKPKGQVIPTRAIEFREMLTQAYNRFPNSRGLVAIASDEMDLKTADTEALYDFRNIYQWDQNAGGGQSDLGYLPMYKTIFYCNYILENIDIAIEGTTEEINQTKGEAYLLRAYSHFVISNIFGDQYQPGINDQLKTAPLVTLVDLDASPFPSTLKAMNDSIVADINRGKKLMSVDKQEKAILKYRFSQNAANAFEARFYLYTGQWALALEAAQKVIGNDAYSLVDFANFGDEDELPTHFESSESILALEKTCEFQIQDAVVASSALTDAFDQTNDIRFAKYLKYDYDASGYKFSSNKVSFDKFKTTFRLSELYLTAAEAAFNLNDFDASKSYLKLLIEKRYSTETVEAEKTLIDNLSETDLKTRVFNERFKELCAEGHRWFDLKRMGKPAITHTVKETADVSKEFILNENDARYVMPFPNEVVQNNPNLNL